MAVGVGIESKPFRVALSQCVCAGGYFHVSSSGNRAVPGREL